MTLQHAHRNRILWRAQSSEDSDAVDAQLGSGVTFQQARSVEISRELLNDTPDRIHWSMSGPQNTAVRQRTGVEIEVPLTMGQSSSNPDPHYAALLKAANFSETLDTNDSPPTATYRPNTGRVIPGATVYKFTRNVENDKSRLMYATDVVLNAEINLSYGEEASISFSGQGYFNEKMTVERNYFDNSNGELITKKDGTSVTPGTQSLAAKNPIIPTGITFEIVDGNANTLTSVAVGELTLDMNLSIDSVDRVTASEGKLQHYATRGTSDAAEGGFDVRDVSAGDLDKLLAVYTEAQKAKITAEVSDVRTSNTEKVEILIPKAQLMAPEMGDNGNLGSYQFNFRATRDTSGSPTIGSSNLEGDNDLRLKYSTG